MGRRQPSIDYDSVADAYARNRQGHETVLSRLASAATGQSRVLEVGCGTGNYISALQEMLGCPCVGVDPSAGMLGKLRARNASVEALEGTAGDLPVPDASFDLVFSVDVIHHVPDTATAFREGARVLRSGGLICTATESEWAIRSRLMAAYFPEIVDTELRRYPPIPRLRREMEASGFVEIREEITEHPYRLEDSKPYRDRAFSALAYLDADSFDRGLRRLEADLTRGPLSAVSRQILLWGTKP